MTIAPDLSAEILAQATAADREINKLAKLAGLAKAATFCITKARQFEQKRNGAGRPVR